MVAFASFLLQPAWEPKDLSKVKRNKSSQKKTLGPPAQRTGFLPPFFMCPVLYTTKQNPRESISLSLSLRATLTGKRRIR